MVAERSSLAARFYADHWIPFNEVRVTRRLSSRVVRTRRKSYPSLIGMVPRRDAASAPASSGLIHRWMTMMDKLRQSSSLPVTKFRQPHPFSKKLTKLPVRIPSPLFPSPNSTFVTRVSKEATLSMPVLQGSVDTRPCSPIETAFWIGYSALLNREERAKHNTLRVETNTEAKWCIFALPPSLLRIFSYPVFSHELARIDQIYLYSSVKLLLTLNNRKMLATMMETTLNAAPITPVTGLWGTYVGILPFSHLYSDISWNEEERYMGYVLSGMMR